MTRFLLTASTEKQRKDEESKRNEQRFDAYNTRRQARGLPELPWTEYLARKHRVQQVVDDVTHLAAAGATPENRDKITLFTR